MRTLLYSPDSFGLGHARRSISLARTLLRSFPGSRSRLLTGAPRAHYFDFPSGCDYFKLPTVTKDDTGRYVGTDVDLSLNETVELRARLISETLGTWQPDLFLVDHSPLGLCGEVLPALRRLSSVSRRPLRVLGMRDVIDEPEAVRAAWTRDGVVDILRDCYDLVLVYGERELFDPISEYDIPADVAAKMRFVGYIPRNGRKADPEQLRRSRAPRTGELVVVTLGGGGDGRFLMERFCEGYAALGEDAPFEVVAVTGPLMRARDRDAFRAMAWGVPGLTVREYCPEMPDLLEAASFVVSMGGYNTVCELACAGARSLIVPRVFPRKEQLLRARRLEARGVARCLLPEEATSAALMREVLSGLGRSRPARGWGLSFTGLDETARTLRGLVRPRAAVA